MKMLLLAASATLLLLALANRRRDVLELVESIDSSSSADDIDTVPTWYGQPELDEPAADPIEPPSGALSSFEALLALVDPMTYMPTLTDAYTEARNERAFLAMIRHAEGTAGANGYRTRFGGGIFSNDYRDHPRIAVQFTDRAGRKLWTSAAGAYQFMAVSPIPNGLSQSTKVDTWDRVARKLGLVDFSPASQDRAALYLIDEAGALNDVRAGRFGDAVNKVRRIWASLPGAGYAQPERSLASLESIYLSAGGQLA